MVRCIVSLGCILLPTTFVTAVLADESDSLQRTCFTFRELVVLEGTLPSRNAWSPSGATLVYREAESARLTAFDVLLPDRGSWPVLDRLVGPLMWSPDGRWLLGRYRTGNGALTTQHLLAFSLSGGEAVHLVEARTIFGFFWGQNGTIYYCLEDAPKLAAASPPASWLEEASGPAGAGEQIVVLPGTWKGMHPRGWPSRVVTSAGEPPAIHPFPAASDSITRFVMQDLFPDGRFLTTVFTRSGGRIVVMDFEGHVTRSFPSSMEKTDDGLFRTSFHPSSVSSDGAFLVGHRTVEDGHFVHECSTLVAGVEGDWLVPLTDAPGGINPQLSREGFFVAIPDCHESRIHVGVIEAVLR